MKPLFKDVDVYDPAQDKDKGLLSQVYENVVGGLTDMLKNERRDEVATQTELSGSVENPKTNTWQLVVNLIQNAFFNAVLPGLEKRAPA